MIYKAALLATLLSAAPVSAHEWYSAACCSGQDCEAIPEHSVTVEGDRYKVTLRHGDHSMLGKNDEIVTYFLDPNDQTGRTDSRALQGEDSDFHACVVMSYNGQGTGSAWYVRCLYVPRRTM